MSILSRLRALFSTQRTLPLSGTAYSVYSNLDANTNIDHFSNISNLYAVIDFIVSKAAKVPFILYKVNSDGKKELVTNHKLLELFEKPNEFLSRTEFLRQVYAYRLVTGNSYIYAPRLDNGITIELWPIPSNFVTIKTTGTYGVIDEYIVSSPTGTYRLKPEEVCHLKNISLLFHGGQNAIGMSPLSTLSKSIERHKLNYDAQTNQLSNAGAMGALFEKPNSNLPPLDPVQRDRAQQLIDERINNPMSKGKVIYLSTEHGFINFGMTSEQMEIVSDIKFTIQDFCRVFHVPSILFLDDATTYNNLRTARQAAYTDAVLPLVEEFIDKVNKWIVPSYGEGLILDYDTSSIEELQTDKLAQSQWLSNAWWIDVYRKQEIIGEIPDEKMKGVYFVPSGIQKTDLSEASNFEQILNLLYNDAGDN